MATMYVAFLLDFFQPSAQSSGIIDEITRDCYQPLVELFNSDLNPKFTVSLANSLAGLLLEYGKDEVIAKLKTAIDSHKVELVHTGAYHPIFPLIPEQEVKRQIQLDIEFKAEHFGLTTRSGIFSPELCYDDRLIPLYKEMGFRWTLADDQVMEINGIKVPDHDISQVHGVAVLMRSSLWSNWITPTPEASRYPSGREFVARLRGEIASQNRDCYKIIAVAGETFGHHVKYYQETFLRDMLFALKEFESVRLCLVSELLDVGSPHETQMQREEGKGFDYFAPSSWATRPEDYYRGDYYPLWKSGGNPIHENLWRLTDLILGACQGIDFTNTASHGLRELLNRAFYSTQYFWASIWYWDPGLIYEGIDLQMRALYEHARLTRNTRSLKEGEEIYTQLMWEICKRSREEGRGKP